MSGAGTERRPDARGYLRHVDGLRGVSVLLVVLYHAWPDLVPGGFIGVDVFFVISGFLITRLILAERAEGRFSYSGFLLRRVRRLWPSFALVVAMSFGLGWVLLDPAVLAELGRSALSTIGFVSNWYFALTTDYFNQGRAQNFLLHSWSLAVEEQFYLVYPIVLMALARHGRALMWGLGLIWAVSIIAMVSLPASPEAFFMTHLRVWELATGALLFCVAEHGGLSVFRARTGQWAGRVGLTLILATALFMPKAVWWPSIWTMVPVMGAALCIGAAWRGLEVRWLVGLGLISYALYLWHWPILRGLDVLFPRAADGQILIAVLVSVGLAYLAWRYVEEPVRRGRALGSAQALIATFISVSAVLVLIGWQLQAKAGFAGRFSADLVSVAEAQADPRASGIVCHAGAGPLQEMFGFDQADLADIEGVNVCLFGDLTRAPSVVYVGDSHLGAIQHELALRSGHDGPGGAGGIVIASEACPPVPGMVWRREGAETARRCEWVQDLLIRLLESGQIEHTVMVAHWDIYSGDTPTPLTEFNRVFEDFIDLASDATQLHIVLDVPTHDFDVPAGLVREMKWPWLGPVNWLSRDQHEAVRAGYLGLLHAAEARGAVVLHDPVPAFCPDGVCLARTEDGPLFYDASHLTAIGAAFLFDALPDLPR